MIMQELHITGMEFRHYYLAREWDKKWVIKVLYKLRATFSPLLL